MRVAYVCADRGVPVFGRKGCSIHAQEMIRSLVAGGATVELFATRLGGDAPRGLEAVRVHELPRGSGEDAESRERAALAANDDLGAALGGAGRFDLIYERHSLWSYAGMEHARSDQVPGLLEVNAPLIDEQRRYRRLVHEDEAEQAVARAYSAASALLAVSDGMADYLRGHPAARGPVHVVPNGVDPDRFPVRDEGADDPSTFTVGFVGTLKPWHGVQTLIEAFAELHRGDARARLLIVGDGSERESLEKAAEDAGVRDAVTFTGAVDPDEIPGLLSSMHVAVAPYPALDDFYFSPLKLFEYMAAGRAIVAAAIGQIDHVLEHEVTGLLYPPGDMRCLAGLLRRLGNDPSLRRRLGAAARDQAVGEHSWARVAHRVREIASACSSTDLVAGRAV